MKELTPNEVIQRYNQAKQRRSPWESHWQECYDYALPQREGFGQSAGPGSKKTDKLFDATAPDAVDQLSASLLAQLTPPWARWFGLTTGADVAENERHALGVDLEKAATLLQSHFDRSNFAVEMHQCYLDLVTAGSASLLFEESEPGEPSAFRFTSVPLPQVVFEENAFGNLDTTFRRTELTAAQLKTRFPEAQIPNEFLARTEQDHKATVGVVEAVAPESGQFGYLVVLETDAGSSSDPVVLAEGRFSASPFINFRWLKAPGEIYGRSPVMKALPDIKTANKVVELVLKNASIAVTGIWQADDDGVLNPATIKLTPGTIVPKAVGSAGLTPLEAPGRFDLSQLILEELRNSIRRALLADKLGQPESPKMTATEVIERAADMARLLGATYGRLQSELLTPLVTRALAILRRRGEIGDIRIDGRTIELEYKSPLARHQARQDAQNTMLWLESVQVLGPEAQAVIDSAATARWLARSFGVPAELIRDMAGPSTLEDMAAGVAELVAADQMDPVQSAITGELGEGLPEMADG